MAVVRSAARQRIPARRLDPAEFHPQFALKLRSFMQELPPSVGAGCRNSDPPLLFHQSPSRSGGHPGCQALVHCRRLDVGSRSRSQVVRSADPDDPNARRATRNATISEQQSLKNRVRQAAYGAFAAALSLAGDALASEGGLVLFPGTDQHGEWSLPVLLEFGFLILFFFLLVYPVNKLIFKPIFRVLDERDGKIAGTRERAERLFGEADEVLARYEGSVREVRAEAEQARKQVLEGARGDGGSKTAQARGEAEREVAAARAEIAEALEAARGELRAQTEGLAREVASQALGRSLS